MTPSTDNPFAAGVTQADRDAAERFIRDWQIPDSIRGALAALLAITRQASIAQHEGGRDEPVVVTIGAGEIVSNWGTYHGIPAVFLQPPPDGPGEFGAKLDRDYPTDSVPPGTVVLQFKGPATVLLEDIAAAIGQANSPAHPPATRPAALAEDEVELIERLDRLIDVRRDFVTKREAMNAARPALNATPAERALYDERYQADHEAERELFHEALKFAEWAADANLLVAAPRPAALAEDEVEAWRVREVQAIGAAISTRNWHSLEMAYNALRDKMDRALRAPASPRITQQAEEVARLRRVVKGWADWYRLADGDPDCEYLNGKGWEDAEALADMSLSALRALNEQPGGEGG